MKARQQLRGCTLVALLAILVLAMSVPALGQAPKVASPMQDDQTYVSMYQDLLSEFRAKHGPILSKITGPLDTQCEAAADRLVEVQADITEDSDFFPIINLTLVAHLKRKSSLKL